MESSKKFNQEQNIFTERQEPTQVESIRNQVRSSSWRRSSSQSSHDSDWHEWEGGESVAGQPETLQRPTRCQELQGVVDPKHPVGYRAKDKSMPAKQTVDDEDQDETTTPFIRTITWFFTIQDQHVSDRRACDEEVIGCLNMLTQRTAGNTIPEKIESN